MNTNQGPQTAIIGHESHGNTGAKFETLGPDFEIVVVESSNIDVFTLAKRNSSGKVLSTKWHASVESRKHPTLKRMRLLHIILTDADGNAQRIKRAFMSKESLCAFVAANQVGLNDALS